MRDNLQLLFFKRSQTVSDNIEKLKVRSEINIIRRSPDQYETISPLQTKKISSVPVKIFQANENVSVCSINDQSMAYVVKQCKNVKIKARSGSLEPCYSYNDKIVNEVNLHPSESVIAIAKESSLFLQHLESSEVTEISVEGVNQFSYVTWQDLNITALGDNHIIYVWFLPLSGGDLENPEEIKPSDSNEGNITNFVCWNDVLVYGTDNGYLGTYDFDKCDTSRSYYLEGISDKQSISQIFAFDDFFIVGVENNSKIYVYSHDEDKEPSLLQSIEFYISNSSNYQMLFKNIPDNEESSVLIIISRLEPLLFILHFDHATNCFHTIEEFNSKAEFISVSACSSSESLDLLAIQHLPNDQADKVTINTFSYTYHFGELYSPFIHFENIDSETAVDSSFFNVPEKVKNQIEQERIQADPIHTTDDVDEDFDLDNYCFTKDPKLKPIEYHSGEEDDDNIPQHHQDTHVEVDNSDNNNNQNIQTENVVDSSINQSNQESLENQNENQSLPETQKTEVEGDDNETVSANIIQEDKINSILDRNDNNNNNNDDDNDFELPTPNITLVENIDVDVPSFPIPTASPSLQQPEVRSTQNKMEEEEEEDEEGILSSDSNRAATTPRKSNNKNNKSTKKQQITKSNQPNNTNNTPTKNNTATSTTNTTSTPNTNNTTGARRRPKKKKEKQQQNNTQPSPIRPDIPETIFTSSNTSTIPSNLNENDLFAKFSEILAAESKRLETRIAKDRKQREKEFENIAQKLEKTCKDQIQANLDNAFNKKAKEIVSSTILSSIRTDVQNTLREPFSNELKSLFERTLAPNITDSCNKLFENVDRSFQNTISSTAQQLYTTNNIQQLSSTVSSLTQVCNSMVTSISTLASMRSNVASGPVSSFNQPQLTPIEIINQAIAQGNYIHAVDTAVRSSNCDVLDFAIENISDPTLWLNCDQLVDPNVIMALVQQISVTLQTLLELKLEWIKEIAPRIVDNPNPRKPEILHTLITNLDGLVSDMNVNPKVRRDIQFMLPFLQNIYSSC